MNGYKLHAQTEFKAAGWTDENGKFKDEMQEMICNHVLKLLEVFSDEGHSGSSGPYAINIFKQLASFEPLVPLTGEDWEWNDTGHGYQNNRASHVFKDIDGNCYDINGIVWYDWYTDEETGEKYKLHYTNSKSRVPLTFPYTPKTEYRETEAE
jgi:hypothetical protein